MTPLWIPCDNPTCVVERITHRQHPFLAGDAQNRVITLGSSSSRIDEQVDRLIQNRGWRGLVEHGLNVCRLENLLIRVERQPGELAFN